MSNVYYFGEFQSRSFHGDSYKYEYRVRVSSDA